VNSISTLEIRDRVAGPVIALGERVRGLARIVARIPWPRSARHATKQAMILATLLWIAAAVIGFAGPGNRGIAGPLKGADFVHFYTLGHLAAAQQLDTLYNMKALHDAQVALVPSPIRITTRRCIRRRRRSCSCRSRDIHIARRCSSGVSVTVALYALMVWSAWRRVSDQLSDRRLIIAAAAAFPATLELWLSTARSPSSS
jgi:hypothetical protein